MRVSDGRGGQDTGRVTIDVEADLLKVVSVEGLADGVAVRFNRALELEQLALWSSEGVADLSVSTAAGVVLRGSAVLDADGAGLRWMRSGAGVLPGGAYTVQLSTLPGGIADVFGRALAGGEGAAGPGVVVPGALQWTVQAGVGPGTAVVSVGDFMRGPGQAAAVSPGTAVLPVRLSGAAGANVVSFELVPAAGLLQIDGVELAAALAGKATLQVEALAGGEGVRVQVQFAQALLTNAAQVLVEVRASVPAAAASLYGKSAVLDVRALEVRTPAGALLAGADDDALQVVGYLADASGDGAYRTSDVARVQALARELSGTDPRAGSRGFEAWPLVDPVAVADVTRDGRINALDALRVLQHVEGLASETDALLPRPEIPALPAGITGLRFAGPDPVVSLEPQLRGVPGGIVRVPVKLDTAAGLDSAVVRLSYDARSFAVERVTKGSLTRDFEWMVVRNEPGVLEVDLSRVSPLSGGTGTLLEVELRVKAAARPGQSRIDLEMARLNDSRLTLNPEPVVGVDPTDAVVSIVAGQPTSPPAPVVPVDWAGTLRLRGPGEGGGEAGGTGTPPVREDWMNSSWARDLASRLGGEGSGTEGSRPARGLPGRDLLRALNRAFR